MQKNLKQLTAGVLKKDGWTSHAHIPLEKPNWQQLSYSYVFVLFVFLKLKKRILSKICILSCFVRLKSILFVDAVNGIQLE